MYFIYIQMRGVKVPREIYMLDMVKHITGVARMLYWWAVTDKYIIVMERMSPSMNMRMYLNKRGAALKEPAAKHVFRQLVDTFSELERIGVSHNDLHVGNIVVNEDSLEVKVIDFGFATVRPVPEKGEGRLS